LKSFPRGTGVGALWRNIWRNTRIKDAWRLELSMRCGRAASGLAAKD
jgi:hypothetical protein